MAPSINDQPLTPAGRLFIQPLTDLVINCSISCHNPFDINAIRTQLLTSIFLNHPRFCSLMVRNSCGRECWRKTQVDIDRHIIVHEEPLTSDPSISDEEAINDYIADITVSTPLPTDKPLWEIHFFMAHKTAVCRLHHALGDGISLMSALLSCCRRVDDPEKFPTVGGVGKRLEERKEWVFWRLVMMVWYTLVYVTQLGFRGLWVRDETDFSVGAGVELWPRRLATARFKMDDMKIVKGAVHGGTINDVLFGILSSGFSRYLEIQSPKDKSHVLKEGLQLTGVSMVNLRPQAGLQDISKLVNNNSGTRWGNKLGMFLFPIYYHKRGSNPIECVKRAKKMLDKKKLSLEAAFSYTIGRLIMSVFGTKLCSIFNYRVVSNTTFSISNVCGPREEIALAGNPVNYIRVTSSSLPNAIMMHMVSYGAVADMQILVAKEIIPEPKVLAKCFEDALLEMKEAATNSLKDVVIPIDESGHN